MERHARRRRTGLVGATLLVAAGCTGPIVSLGENAGALHAVDPADVSGPAGACPAGYAHPNVCCEASPSEPAVCGESTRNPFLPCDPGWSTYPDPRACCPLDRNDECLAATGNPAPASSCWYACPPGAWQRGDDAGGVTCCVRGPGGAPFCGATRPVPSMCEDAGPTNDADFDGGTFDAADFDASSADATDLDASDRDAADVDGGAFDAGPFDGSGLDAGAAPLAPVAPVARALAACTDGGGPSLCARACPEGWSPGDAPDLCCQMRASGERVCFSQATGAYPGVATPP